MDFQRPPLKEFIRDKKLVSDKQLKEIEALAKEKRLSLSDALREQRKVPQDKIAEILAEYWGVPFVKLSAINVKQDVLDLVPSVMARTHKIIPFKKDKQGIHIALADPTDLPIRRLLAKKFSEPVHFYVATESDVEDMLHLYESSLSKVLDEIIAQDIGKLRSINEEEIELPIIRITDAILHYAASNNASDVHIEPLENFIQVRYRIDGLLHDVVQLPKLILGPIVTRIKILAKLRIDEHFSAQDGRFDFIYDNKKVDCRVSVVPITEGEKVVIRLFTAKSRRLTLEDLGMSEKDLVTLKDAIQKPYGMILASGPTGSGKTTTMYAILQLINNRTINISTIEDPVEYDLEGVNQIQVNERTNLTFARGLRSILRQDPDVIMVGEIRDEDAAGIAVNAAMTGHLVLSTLHANNAATTIPRLIDFHIKPFLLSSSLTLILSQRLVRRICRRCIAPIKLAKAAIDQIDKQLPTTDLAKLVKEHKTKFFRGKGCTGCSYTGYNGRIGIYELLPVDDTIREMIMAEASAKKLEQAARAKGMTTMLEDGLEKVAQGITTIDEIVRVMSV